MVSSLFFDVSSFCLFSAYFSGRLLHITRLWRLCRFPSQPPDELAFAACCTAARQGSSGRPHHPGADAISPGEISPANVVLISTLPPI
jgi:hypothetical protein